MTYYTPTKLYIGKEEQNIGEIIQSYGYKKVLFLYGGGSIKKTGLYDTVVKSLNESSIDFIEEGGIEPNPKVEFVRRVLKKNYTFDMILAVGGGSVIDTAKSISVSMDSNIDPWEFNAHRVTPTKAYPIGVILTISAAGSEMSSSCVISNPEIEGKQGFNSDLVRPKFAIMNPELTYTVSKYQTACGIVDIMMHTLERYITTEPSMLADELAIGLLKTVYKNGLIAYDDPTNYDARRELMLASSFSHNGLTNIARPMCFRAHQLEHVMSGVHDEIAHGAGLSVAWLAYAKFIYKNEKALPKFIRLAYDLFDVTPTENTEIDAYQGILKMEEFFLAIGMPTRMADLGIKEDELEHLSLLVSWNKTRTIKDIINLEYNEFKRIYSLMY